MDSIVTNFHLDLKALIAQAINFGIIFFLLYRFIFKPITKVMEEREDKIEQSLKNAEEIEKRLNLSEEESKKIIAKAKKDSVDIINDARQTAEENSKIMIEKTKEELASLAERERKNIQLEKEKMLKELKTEVGDLVVLATEKIIKEKVNTDKDQEIIDSVLK